MVGGDGREGKEEREEREGREGKEEREFFLLLRRDRRLERDLAPASLHDMREREMTGLWLEARAVEG